MLPDRMLGLLLWLSKIPQQGKSYAAAISSTPHGCLQQGIALGDSGEPLMVLQNGIFRQVGIVSQGD